MKTLINVFLTLSLVIALPAMAISLNEAKNKGLVGEANSGYIAIVGTSSPELKKLVKEVNTKRKAAYTRIAERNKIDIAQVATRAAEKLEARLSPGEYYQNNRGRWVRK
ncbi:YdbL family protein [Microbulbifer sp. SSSA002]|uniref:YdbL family protein n=1 Tax=unclassified Microbulbifer TaxID=2619833 RepID=UPI00403A29B8